MRIFFLIPRVGGWVGRVWVIQFNSILGGQKIRGTDRADRIDNLLRRASRCPLIQSLGQYHLPVVDGSITRRKSEWEKKLSHYQKRTSLQIQFLFFSRRHHPQLNIFLPSNSDRDQFRLWRRTRPLPDLMTTAERLGWSPLASVGRRGGRNSTGTFPATIQSTPYTILR